MRSFFLLLLLYTIPGAVQAQGTRAAVEENLLLLNLSEASRLAAELPEDADKLYYQSRVAFFRFLLTEDPKALETFLEQAGESLDRLEELPQSTPSLEVRIAEIHLLRGAARALDQRYVGAVWDIRSACSWIETASENNPHAPEPRKLQGVFEVAMSAVPRKLKWLSNAFCFPGELEQGMEHLEQAAARSSLLPMEAEMALFYFEKNLLSEPGKAHLRAERLLARNPGSPVWAYLKLSSLLELRQVDEAIEFGEARDSSTMARISLPLWDFALAKAHYFRLDLPEAIAGFDKFIGGYKGNTLVSDALFRKGMALVLQDRYPEARKVFHEMAGVESSTFDEDEYASHMASIYRFREPTEVEKTLFRARNLFDGGYYQRSLGVLAELNGQTLNENEATEQDYRLGRNAQALGRLSEAREAYRKCIAHSPGQALWMKVYAHYYLGQMAENENNLAEARRWYEQALDFDRYEYQSGLEQRCKAALQRIKARQPEQ